MTDTPSSSALEQRLRAGAFVLTAEVVPPASCDADDLLKKALPLRSLADAVNVTDGAGARAHMGATAAAGILMQHGIEPILQLACRDRNRIALQGELMGAAALGIRNLLLLRGDDPTAGDQPDAKPVFDLDTAGLLLTAAGIRDRGELPSGRKVAGHADFFLGVADSPIDSPRSLCNSLGCRRHRFRPLLVPRASLPRSARAHTLIFAQRLTADACHADPNHRMSEDVGRYPTLILRRVLD